MKKILIVSLREDIKPYKDCATIAGNITIFHIGWGAPGDKRSEAESINSDLPHGLGSRLRLS